ncbi:type III-A CRISPR-associated RAMP protein Csm3 [uncultured Methanobrevibacter sp.]|uniref:type III-A CRISPR-associated RAMP protein Csm3 n=1 Tax=uncultured Methanobrevibacter sp. TaxID=253161 RepID=UPI00262674B5|nr:type III-A CRISPR-associated RAMP protein Csm3 [uncultured Methanobrevibacter sp.]
MFKENYIIKGEIVCETGLHIGGSNDNIEIGGSDNVVIRDSTSDLPFIPGSSLKGKLRSLLELSDKDSAQDVIKNKGKVSSDENTIAAQIFGVSADTQKEFKFPTRIIVRDSFPNEETIDLWKKTEEVVRGTELKYENTLNRINASANPRNIERIPKGSKFNFEIIFSVYEGDNENILSLFESMSLLEDNYLGGSGSRGFGKVRFDNITISKRDQEYYKEGKNQEPLIKDADLEKVIEHFKK